MKRKKKKTTSFVLWKEENWGFCFPGNGCAKAKRARGPVGVAHKARTEPLAFTAPGNRLPRPGMPGAGLPARNRDKEL